MRRWVRRMKDWPKVEQAFLRAASGQGDWNDAMEIVAKVTGSFGALLFPVHGHLAAIPHSASMLPSTEAYFQQKWHERDERWAGLAHLKTHGITSEFDFTSPDLMKKSAYYEDFLRPHSLRWFAALCIRSDKEFWSLSLQRTIAQGPFQSDELSQLRSLADRLHAAADISRAMGTARIEGAARAFEISQTPVLFLSRTAEVILANRAAEALFLQGDIGLSSGRLHLRTAAAGTRLDLALKEVLQSREHSSSRIVRIPRPEGRGLVARIVRFEDATQNSMGLCQAVVIFHDLDRSRLPALDRWAEVFNLTAAECRLVEALVQGFSLEQTAAAMNLSRETLRTRLQDIFGKTQVSRQAELVALFARLSS